MKKLNLLLAGLILSGAAISCSDDDSSSTSNANATAIANNMKSGTWRVTNFTEDGNDETGHFTNYAFSFNESGVLIATDGTNTHNGVWSVTDSDSSDDDDNGNNNDIDFNINFVGPAEFTDLSDDWDVVERTGVMITLKDVSGGNGGTDYLTFKKN